jgi:hypothetical protein
MSVASPYNPNFIIDNLERCMCFDCYKSFIVGEDLSEGIKLSCPYCKSENVERVACTTDDRPVDLGCVGITYTKGETNE